MKLRLLKLPRFTTALLLPLFFLPFFCSADVTIDNPINATSIQAIISNVADFAFLMGVIIAPIMIVIAGFYFITAMGEPAKIQKARQFLTWTIVGLVIILLSKGIVVLIVNILGAKKA